MHRKTDSETEQWVLRELNLSEKVCSPEICVLARDGVVRLRGSAQSFAERSAVEEATRRASGVVGVVNEIRVRPCTALLKKVSPHAVLAEALRPDRIVHRIAYERTVAKVATHHEMTRAAAGSE